MKRKFIFLLLISSLLGFSVRSQVYIGLGYGAFNLPSEFSSTKLTGTGFTLGSEYLSSNFQTSYYFDVSSYKKVKQLNSITIVDQNGTAIGITDATNKISNTYLQFGIKRLLNGDADEKKILLFAGAGGALVFSNSKTNYTNTSLNLSDDKAQKTLYGLNFITGLQYYLKPIIIQMKGNLDFLFSSLDSDSGIHDISTNIRLALYMPLIKN